MDEIKFSDKVKDEAIRSLTDKDRRYACLYGILLFLKHFTDELILYQTENENAAVLVLNIIEEIFGGKIKTKYQKTDRGKGSHLFTVSIDDKKNISLINGVFHIEPNERKVNLTNIDNNNISVFISGVFLSCGSVSDPQKEYHLEFTIPTERLCADFCDMLKPYGFSLKTVKRKQSFVAYIKDSEKIEDMITLMGAQLATLEIINIKIFKDVRNKANRVANCDSANIDKQIKAAEKQIEDIMLISEKTGLHKLPEDLRKIAYLRLENPEASLREIGEQLKSPLPRSGVNYRFKRISAIAEKLKEEGST